MLIDRSTGMLGTARALTSRLHQTACWGCARLLDGTLARSLHVQAYPVLRPPTYSNHAAADFHAQSYPRFTTCAALQTRESPLALDPGDYEAGQIQARANTCRHLQRRTSLAAANLTSCTYAGS